MPDFRAEHPNIRFCINGVGDVPVRLGAPDVRITLDAGPGESLFHDVLLPVTGPDSSRRIACYDPASRPSRCRSTSPLPTPTGCASAQGQRTGRRSGRSPVWLRDSARITQTELDRLTS